jgi:hypothetical protein
VEWGFIELRKSLDTCKSLNIYIFSSKIKNNQSRQSGEVIIYGLTNECQMIHRKRNPPGQSIESLPLYHRAGRKEN